MTDSISDINARLDDQLNLPLGGNNNEGEEDESVTIEDYEFINPRDPREIHSLPDQTDGSVVEIAGFSREKLLEMSNLCKISYGDDDEKVDQEYCKSTFKIKEDEEWVDVDTEKMYKAKAKLIEEGYEIIPFGNSFEKDAGHVFIKGNEVTIAYHGTRFKHGLNDVITDFNFLFTTSELLPEGGRMHRGFYNSFIDSWPSLYGVLKSHAEERGSEIKDFKINLTGHSMGGALAKIAALCLNKTEKAEDLHVATFGDPRVFDLTASEVYNEVLQEKTIRVTHHRQDPVPAVAPGSFGYAHVGAQLRVPVSEGYNPYTIKGFHGTDGYHEAIKVMDENDFQSNNDVSLFYYPSRILGKVSCAFGWLQSYAAGAYGYVAGESNFFEKVKNDYKASHAKQAEDKLFQVEQEDKLKDSSQLEQLYQSLPPVMGIEDKLFQIEQVEPYRSLPPVRNRACGC